jgi:hypothetical protein
MMTPDEVETAVEAAVGRAIDAKLGQFYIDRETHFKDHEWIQELRKWSDEIKGTVLRSFVKIVITAMIGLTILGFIVWGKEHFK